MKHSTLQDILPNYLLQTPQTCRPAIYRRCFDIFSTQKLWIAIFSVAAFAGATLAHMNINAQARPFPFLFSGNIIRMPITEDTIIGKIIQPNKRQDNELTNGQASVSGPINFEITTTPEYDHPKSQAPEQMQLVSFANGKVAIRTLDGSIPITAHSKESPIFFASGSSVNRLSNIIANFDTTKNFSAMKYSSGSNPTDSKSIFQCTFADRVTLDQDNSFANRFSILGTNAIYSARANEYKNLVKQYASKYRLTPSLIMAIMHTESHFNPFAVSNNRALGLMQVVPETAGWEVHRYLTGQETVPSVESLLHPEKNILYGTTYIHLLNKRYFNQIVNTASRKLCIIAAYNGGPNAVFKVFSPNQSEAIRKINKMTTKELYRTLTTHMPTPESRNYVVKVLAYINTYGD